MKQGRNGIVYRDVLAFYKGRKVLVTGNTGFKGAWLTRILLNFGAQVTGYALGPAGPSLFEAAGLEGHPCLRQVYGDVTHIRTLRDTFELAAPEIVLHLAAQPIVRESYRRPAETYRTNVMGTVNILECVRTSEYVKSFLNVTTDKVYKNFEWEYGYREEDPLDGHDPYSNSKSCSELVTHSYRASFFAGGKVGISTARAGNVIGGGDFAADRIIPDSVRAVKAAWEAGKREAEILVRNPHSIRPYQHVLEPLFLYLTIAMKQYQDTGYAGCYNVGPDDCDCVATGDLVELFCHQWNKETSPFPRAAWRNEAEADAPHEASFLKLDCSRVKGVFGWRPRWHIDKAVEETVAFSRVWMSGGNVSAEMDREIEEYLG